jgi:hypothetical protein
MRKYWIILTLIFITTSCKLIYHSAPSFIKEWMFKYPDSLSGLNDKLNINGYYTIDDELNSGYIYGNYTNMIFFDDGMFVSGFFNLKDIETSKVGQVIPKYIDRLIKSRDNGERVYEFYEGCIWGYYFVKGDTIIVRNIKRPFLGSSDSFWYSDEKWFKIIDKDSICTILSSPWIDEAAKNKSQLCMYFRPLIQRPESDGWLKYEKWFWQDKVKYKTWLKKQNK